MSDLDATCARCGATDVPLALSSKSGFKRKVCASVSACRQRRKMARLLAEVAALRQQLDEARGETLKDAAQRLVKLAEVHRRAWDQTWDRGWVAGMEHAAHTLANAVDGGWDS